jgi:hypothetical protein
MSAANSDSNSKFVFCVLIRAYVPFLIHMFDSFDLSEIRTTPQPLSTMLASNIPKVSISSISRRMYSSHRCVFGTLVNIVVFCLRRFDTRINTRDAYLDAAISDSSHSEYLWRLVYDSSVKDIPLLLINFFYVTEIAVLGISPINAMSFVLGAIDVPISLFHAYYAYLNQPATLTSHKTFARPANTAVRVEFDYDHTDTRGKQIPTVALPPALPAIELSSPIASFQRRPSVLNSPTATSSASANEAEMDDSRSDVTDIWSSVSVGGTVTHRMSKPIKPADWIKTRPKLTA